MAFKMNGWSAFNKPEEQQATNPGTSKLKQGINKIINTVKDQFTSREPSKDHMYSNRVDTEGKDVKKPLKKKKYK